MRNQNLSEPWIMDTTFIFLEQSKKTSRIDWKQIDPTTTCPSYPPPNIIHLSLWASFLKSFSALPSPSLYLDITEFIHPNLPPPPNFQLLNLALIQFFHCWGLSGCSFPNLSTSRLDLTSTSYHSQNRQSKTPTLPTRFTPLKLWMFALRSGVKSRWTNVWCAKDLVVADSVTCHSR